MPENGEIVSTQGREQNEKGRMSKSGRGKEKLKGRKSKLGPGWPLPLPHSSALWQCAYPTVLCLSLPPMHDWESLGLINACWVKRIKLVRNSILKTWLKRHSGQREARS